MTIETRNAVIKSVSLSAADHGCLSAWLHLDYGGEGQGFGGYALYSPGHDDNAGFFIWRVLEVVGASKWEDLPGRSLRTRGDDSRIVAIGHFLKDEWFEPGVEMK